VDRINGGYQLINYKIGENIPDKKKRENNLQLSIYSTGFYKLFKIVPIKAGFYCLRQRQKLSFVPAEKDTPATIKLICSAAEKIKEENFQANKGRFYKSFLFVLEKQRRKL